MRVKDFLELPALKDLKLISGTSGLENEITSVNIMDNPHALDWFSPGELLITSGYFIKDSDEAQQALMRRLHSIHCPALCIKPMQFLHTIPPDMIRLGDELSIPVIELPYGIPFSRITSVVWETLSVGYDLMNRRSLDAHEAFFRASLQGQGLPHIASILARMIGNPVVFLDTFYNLLAWEDLPGNPVPLRQVAKTVGSGSLLDQSYRDSLPPAFEVLQTPICRYFQAFGVDTVIIPVYVLNIHYGYILVWRTMRELSANDYIALKNCTMTFALERIRSQEISRARNRMRRDFFQDLVSGAITDPDNLAYLCGLYRVNQGLVYAPIILSLRFPQTASQDLLEQKRQEDESLHKILRHFDAWRPDGAATLHAFSYREQIILLLGFHPQLQDTYTPPAMKDLCRQLIQQAKQIVPGLCINAGIGSISPSLMAFSHSYRRAEEALRLALRTPTQESIHHYQDFVVHRFLEQNISQTEMAQFFRETLEPLALQDQKSGGVLMPTLEAWIENHCNIVKTAKALYTHRNTVIYRMERISALLHADLKDPEELLKFQLALKVYHLMHDKDAFFAR